MSRPEVGLVEHGEAWLQHRHLQYLVALLLAAGETDIDRAAQHVLADAKMSRGVAHDLHEFRRGGLRLAARLALGVERGAQKSHGGDTRDLHRILEGEEHALGRALVGRHLQNAFAIEQHVALGDRVVVLAGQHIGERRLAGAVRAHDGRDLALLDRQVEAVQYLLAVDFDVQVFDFK